MGSSGRLESAVAESRSMNPERAIERNVPAQVTGGDVARTGTAQRLLEYEGDRREERKAVEQRRRLVELGNALVDDAAHPADLFEPGPRGDRLAGRPARLVVVPGTRRGHGEHSVGAGIEQVLLERERQRGQVGDALAAVAGQVGFVERAAPRAGHGVAQHGVGRGVSAMNRVGRCVVLGLACLAHRGSCCGSGVSAAITLGTTITEDSKQRERPRQVSMPSPASAG